MDLGRADVGWRSFGWEGSDEDTLWEYGKLSQKLILSVSNKLRKSDQVLITTRKIRSSQFYLKFSLSIRFRQSDQILITNRIIKSSQFRMLISVDQNEGFWNFWVISISIFCSLFPNVGLGIEGRREGGGQRCAKNMHSTFLGGNRGWGLKKNLSVFAEIGELYGKVS